MCTTRSRTPGRRCDPGRKPASPQPVNTPVTFTATATGGGASKEYQFAVKDPVSGVMTVKQSYGSSNTFPYTPVNAGTYTIRVYVRNVGSAASYERPVAHLHGDAVGTMP